MSTKYTQGEWVVDAENNLIHAIDDRHTVICSFHGSMRNPSVAADARLISAAPELLEAAKLVIAWYEAEDDHSKADFCQRMQMCRDSESALRAAIAKATGEQA